MSATENGTSPGLHYAKFWQRAAAFVIDGLLYQVGGMIFFFAVLLVIAFLPGADSAGPPTQQQGLAYEAATAMFIIFGWVLVVPILVFSLPLRVWEGQTVGKKLLGIKVVDNVGNNLSWVQCVVRPVSYIFSMIGLLGFLWCLWDGERRCWHDFIACTHVVRLMD